MLLERLLSIHVAILVALSGLMVGIAQQRVFLSLLVLVAVSASLWLTDFTGRFRLNRVSANLALLAAVLVCGWDFFRKGGLPETVVFANLLGYVEIVLLFQRKDLRAWIQLSILSVIQLMVATLSNQSIWLGLLSFGYLAAGLSTMCLLFLYYERTSYDQEGNIRGYSAHAHGWLPRLDVDWQRLRKIALATLLVGPLSLFLRYRESSSPSGARGQEKEGPLGSGRWPLVSQTRVFMVPEKDDDGPHGLGWRLWTCLARLIPATLVVGAIVFPLVPRFGRFELVFYRHGWFDLRNQEHDPIRRMGFSDEVALGELGLLADDLGKVAEVQFLKSGLNEPYEVQGDVYLRGAVLTRYQDGQWQHHGPRHSLPRRGDSEPLEELVWQRITIEPMDRREVFCVWPVVLPDLDEYLNYNQNTQRLLRSRRQREERLTFVLPTKGIAKGTLPQLIPSDRPTATGHLLELPPGEMPNLDSLVRQWVEESGTAESDWTGLAQLLESKLRDSGQFAYSLVEGPRDEALDPVEDFLINNPSGNCEYFATALTLMLRTRGIPARVVVGYKTTEYSNLQDVYTVRQSHAHTWVEAYLDPQHLPEDWPETDWFADWSHGAWLRLDPTPARNLTAVQALFSGVEDWFAWVLHLWDTYVAGMTSGRQRETVYGPLGSSVVRGARDLLDADWWYNVWSAARDSPKKLISFLAEGAWFSWRGGLVLAVALALCYLGFRVVRLAVGRVRQYLAKTKESPSDRRRVLVAFYKRLEAVLARQGLVRSASQTHREFTMDAGIRIAESTDQAQLAELPVQIAEAFYRVRFGGIALDGRQTESIERALGQLEQAMDGKPALPATP